MLDPYSTAYKIGHTPYKVAYKKHKSAYKMAETAYNLMKTAYKKITITIWIQVVTERKVFIKDMIMGFIKI